MNSNMKSVLRNYIQNCGEGRGLDKFLRRNSFSSDEKESPITTTVRKTKTKSLENLTEASSNKKSESLHKIPSKERIRTPQKEPEDKNSMEGAKVIVKQSGEKVDKKKTFNYESVIEITLPSQPQQSIMPLSLSVPELSKEVSFDEKIEEPIKPIIYTPKSSNIPSHNKNSDKKVSPSSGNDEESFVSNKQNPMEWDDFIPGYETEISQIENASMQLCNNPMELNDNELNALKTYFHQRGLELPNENLIVVIKNRQEKVSEGERALEHIRKNKEKWQNIYEKYKEKYQKSQQQTTIDFEEAEAQSTPKIPDSSINTRVTEYVNQSAIMNEKESQTSLVRSCVKSIQVESASINRNLFKTAPKETTTMNTVGSRTDDEVYQNPSEAADSFEFMHGSRAKQADELSKKSTSVATEAGSSRNSILSESLKNEDISNFDDSLKVAIALLNSLLESNMRPELKRNLAEKVIQKIVQLQTSKSIQTSSIENSASSAPPTSSRNSIAAKSAKQKVSREEALKDCLKPMTLSEKSHQNSRSDESAEERTAKDNDSIPKNQLIDFVRREKKTQLKWIEKEIEHLNNLRDYLKRNETLMSVSESCPIYENLSSKDSQKEESSQKLNDLKATDVNFWNSHAKMKRFKNRSKLDIPQSETNASRCESLASFIDTRNRKFLEKYSQQQKKLYEEANAYTQPKSQVSKKKSEALESKKSLTKRALSKDAQTSTSLASSVFESSESNSLVAENNTQHQKNSHATSRPHSKHMDPKQKVAVTQTTDSICRTRPIYEAKNEANSKFGTSSTVATKRVQKLQNDKQLQAHPPSVKYTLTFDKKSKPKMRLYSSLPQKPNDYGTITKNSKDIYNQISYSASLNYYYSDNKENYGNDILFDDSEDDVDLQNCFNKKCPKIFSRFEQRKKCIEELRKLRALRNEHRSKLLLLTSEKSLEGKLFSSLPELPLKQTRMFSTKALKLQTKRVVKNLNEVQQKKKEENLKNLKKKTRLMTEIFNKNLQRNVLRGNLNLSNTVNLITK